LALPVLALVELKVAVLLYVAQFWAVVAAVMCTVRLAPAARVIGWPARVSY